MHGGFVVHALSPIIAAIADRYTQVVSLQRPLALDLTVVHASHKSLAGL